MAVSLSNLVQPVRDILGDRPFTDTSTTTTTSTTVVVADTTLYAVGQVLEWQTGTVGYEQMYIKALASSTDLTVTRGYAGTTAETHTSGDSIIVLSADSFSGRTIQNSLTQVMNKSYPQVWKPGTADLTWDGTTKWYDLETTTLGIISVTQKKNSTQTDFGRFRDPYTGGSLSYIVQRDLPSSIAATSGIGISFPQGVYDSRTSGGNAIVVRTVEALTGTSDIEDSASLPMAEAIVWGACARLLRAKEAQRVVHGEPAIITGSVSTGSRVGLAREYEQEWQQGLESLKVKLFNLYDPDEIWVA